MTPYFAFVGAREPDAEVVRRDNGVAPVESRRRGRKPRVMQDLDPEATIEGLREIQKMVEANCSDFVIADRFEVSESQAGRWVKWAEELPPAKETD